MTYTKADEARDIGFAWMAGVQRAVDDRRYGIFRGSVRPKAKMEGYHPDSAMIEAYVAGYRFEIGEDH